MHTETFHELGMRYISKIPTPDYEYAEKCLKISKEIQTKVSDMTKEIMEQIEEFKFSVYKICKEAQKYCENYVEYVRFF